MRGKFHFQISLPSEDDAIEVQIALEREPIPGVVVRRHYKKRWMLLLWANDDETVGRVREQVTAHAVVRSLSKAGERKPGTFFIPTLGKSFEMVETKESDFYDDP
jgi:hypothetical protein